jgi:hypothetical protein
MQTIPTHPKNNSQFIEGMYNCLSFSSVGFYFTLAKKFNRMASFINVNEPLISA